MSSDVREMDKTNFTDRILSLTLEIIHLLTGEEYTVSGKSRIRSCASGGWSRTQDTTTDPPPTSMTPETKNLKKILQVSNNIIHLLTGEVLSCFEAQEDLCEDLVILDQQPLALDLPKSKNKRKGLRNQEKIGSISGGSMSLERQERSDLAQQSPQRKDLPSDPDTDPFQGYQLSPRTPVLCDVGAGLSSDDREDIDFTMVRIKEEREMWEDGEEFDEDDLAEVEPLMGEDVLPSQPHTNGQTGMGYTYNRAPSETKGLVGQLNPAPSQTIPNAKTYRCPECPEVFSCRSDLLKHQSHHRGSPLFACPACGKNFTSKSNLAKHQKIHTGEKPYSCPDCGKSFREKHYLASHQAVHRGAQLIACPQCGKGYTSKSNLAKHQRTHTGQKPFGCSICGKSFNQRSVLLAHQRTHTGERPFPCDWCPQRFIDKSRLERHRSSHSGEEASGPSFTRKDLLLKHLSAHSMDGFPD